MFYLRLISLLLVLLPFSRTKAADFSVQVEEAVNREIQMLLRDEKFKAVSVALFIKGREYQFHYGLLKDGKPPDGDSLYEIGSITKVYTGMLLAQAVLDRKIKLDDDVRIYLGSEKYKNLTKGDSFVTFRHLAAHTSGLPKDFAYTQDNAKNGLVLERLSNYSKKKFFRDLKRVELLSVPGSEYRYSNVGADLTAYILEKIYGESFESLLRRYIFARTSETDTRLNSGKSPPPAAGFNEKGEEMPFLSRRLYAEGGLNSTTKSILRFLAYHVSSQEPVVKESQRLIAGEASGNGRAYFWNTFNYQSDGMLYHSGGTLGTSSWMAVYPKKGIGVFLVTNTSTSDSQEQLNVVSNKIVEEIERLAGKP